MAEDEKFTQIHKLWRAFFARLEGRGLAFNDVVAKEGRRYILEDLCFISEEAAMLETEWHCIVLLLQRAQVFRAGRPNASDVHNFGPCGWEKLRANLSRKTVDAIEEVNRVIDLIEEYNDSISSALTSIEHCEYRVNLYSNFLVDQIYSQGKVDHKSLTSHDCKVAQSKIEKKVREYLEVCAARRDDISARRRYLCKDVVPWLLCVLRALHAMSVTLNIHRDRRQQPDRSVFQTLLMPLRDASLIDPTLSAIEVPNLVRLGSFDKFVVQPVPLQTVSEGGRLNMPSVMSLKNEFASSSMNLKLSSSFQREMPGFIASALPPIIESDDDASVSGKSAVVLHNRVVSAAGGAAAIIAAMAATTADHCLHVRGRLRLASSGGVPYRYDRVVVHGGGVLTTLPWDGGQGGVLQFHCNTFVVEAGGCVNLTGLGYRGGVDLSPDYPKLAQQGENELGLGGYGAGCNRGGGGGATAEPDVGTWGGGGGGGATAGEPGRPVRGGGEGGTPAAPGGMGCGGGAGHPLIPVLGGDSDSDTFTGSSDDEDFDLLPGGSGGGWLCVDASLAVEVHGRILCNGGDGAHASFVGAAAAGGGGGGTVFLRAPTILNDGDIQANGGRGGSAASIPGKTPLWQPYGGQGADGTIILSTEAMPKAAVAMDSTACSMATTDEAASTVATVSALPPTPPPYD